MDSYYIKATLINGCNWKQDEYTCRETLLWYMREYGTDKTFIQVRGGHNWSDRQLGVFTADYPGIVLQSLPQGVLMSWKGSNFNYYDVSSMIYRMCNGYSDSAVEDLIYKEAGSGDQTLSNIVYAIFRKYNFLDESVYLKNTQNGPQSFLRSCFSTNIEAKADMVERKLKEVGLSLPHPYKYLLGISGYGW